MDLEEIIELSTNKHSDATLSVGETPNCCEYEKFDGHILTATARTEKTEKYTRIEFK